MIIRKGNLEDAVLLQKLFVDTIIHIGKTYYDNNQIKAWCSAMEDINRWKQIILTQFVLVAQCDDIITGFCTLDSGNYIDFLYVHKDFQRKGVASGLYKETEKEAIRQNQITLTADVSKPAKAFFEKAGFKTISEQTVLRQGVKIINYKMEKNLKKDD